MAVKPTPVSLIICLECFSIPSNFRNSYQDGTDHYKKSKQCTVGQTTDHTVQHPLAVYSWPDNRSYCIASSSSVQLARQQIILYSSLQQCTVDQTTDHTVQHPLAVYSWLHFQHTYFDTLFIKKRKKKKKKKEAGMMLTNILWQ